MTVVLAGFALAQDDLPAPRLTATPASQTSSQAASFTYTDTAAIGRFQCSLDGAAFQDCGATKPSSKSYSGLAYGRHTFKVRAVAGSKTSESTSFSWTIGRPPPPIPTFSQEPPNPSSSPVATFAWTSHPATDVNHYECREDEHAWLRCTSPLTFTVSGDGEHQFAVRAVDAAGNASGEAQYKWKLSSGGNHLPFTISGGAGGQLYPGAAPRALALTLSNPNSVAIFVTALSVTVTTSPPGCPAAGNLALIQPNASSATSVQVPAKGSVTLPAQGVSAPTVQLLDLPVNQDACRGAGFGLIYTGSAHS